MPPPDRAETFENAPIAILLSILLRQLRRPLATQGVKLSDADAERWAQARVSGGEAANPPELNAALKALVAESDSVLARLGLSFEAALAASMDQVPGWETTAEFLELANDKSNAELRITLGAALALVFGRDRQYAPYLLHLAAHDYGDESVIARRTLAFVSGADPHTPDWLGEARRRLKLDP